MIIDPHHMAFLPSQKGEAEAPAVQPTLAELDRVRVTAVVESDSGGTIPAGSMGTVVAVWAGGSSYDVEFTAPVEGLATVRAADVQALRPGE